MNSNKQENELGHGYFCSRKCCRQSLSIEEMILPPQTRTLITSTKHEQGEGVSIGGFHHHYIYLCNIDVFVMGSPFFSFS